MLVASDDDRSLGRSSGLITRVSYMVLKVFQGAVTIKAVISRRLKIVSVMSVTAIIGCDLVAIKVVTFI